jgi:hypothetical protein
MADSRSRLAWREAGHPLIEPFHKSEMGNQPSPVLECGVAESSLNAVAMHSSTGSTERLEF